MTDLPHIGLYRFAPHRDFLPYSLLHSRMLLAWGHISLVPARMLSDFVLCSRRRGGAVRDDSGWLSRTRDCVSMYTSCRRTLRVVVCYASSYAACRRPQRFVSSYALCRRAGPPIELTALSFVLFCFRFYPPRQSPATLRRTFIEHPLPTTTIYHRITYTRIN